MVQLPVQALAFVELQVSVELAPIGIDVGFALSVAVSDCGDCTFTVTDAFAVGGFGPEPEQTIEYVVDVVGLTATLPFVGTAPWAHVPTQDAAFAEPHVSVELSPAVIETGFAVSDAVGNCDGCTVTVAEAVAVGESSPAALQTIEYVVVAPGVTTTVPAVAT